MIRTQMIPTTFAALLLASGAAFGQSGSTPATSPTPLAAQERAAAQAGQAGDAQRQVSALLRDAEKAVSEGNWAMANAYVERAETTWLNRAEMRGNATPTPPDSFTRANEAIRNRNRGQATSAIQAIMGEVSRGASMPARGGQMASGGDTQPRR